ncbi:glycosyltransferase [Natrialbaceae archaeon A-chndr2]
MTSGIGETTVSVIIPVYNDPEGVRTTVESLINQIYPNYRIVPVDNNSSDRTDSVLTTASTEHPNLVSPSKETDVQSSYAARNTGIKHVSSDILLFLDADMWVEETWIEEMVTTLESRNCDYLGCNVEVVPENESPTFCERYEQALSFPVETYLEREHFVPTCALAVRREVFEEVGLFDHRLESGGDKEFGQRVHEAGFKQCYADSITAYHPARTSLSEVHSKAQRIGRGRAQMRRYNPEHSDYEHPLHPVRFLPPSPFRLRRRYSGSEVSTLDMVGFYALEYGLKLTQTVSSIREAISIRGDE